MQIFPRPAYDRTDSRIPAAQRLARKAAGQIRRKAQNLKNLESAAGA